MMTSVGSVLALCAERNITLAVMSGGLTYGAPPGAMTAALRNELRTFKFPIIDQITRPPEPVESCLGCNTKAWSWTVDWPEPGEGRWLCETCMSRPTRSWSEVAAELTDAERRQLHDEAAAGSVLAKMVLAEMTNNGGMAPPSNQRRRTRP